MSMLLMASAMKIKVGNPTRKLILIKLADNANDNGECWPSYQHIADHCEVSKRSVMTHIKALESAGLLYREHRKGPKGNHSNVYHLTLKPSENHSLPSENHSLPSENHSLPPSENISPRTYHSFEPIKEPIKEPNNSMSSKLDAVEIIEHLNAVCGTRFQKKNKSALGLINARMNDGFTKEDLKAVIESKYKEWGSDSKMARYLRPQTLFNVNKFPSYLSATAQPSISGLSKITQKNLSNLEGEW